MADLPDPVRELLEAEVDEADVAKMWRGINARRASTTHPAVWPVAATALVAVAAAFTIYITQPSPPAALATEDGHVALGAFAPASTTQYDDGSWVSANAHVVASVVANAPSEFVIGLEHGQIDVQVTPGGPRRWRVDAGDAQVEVVGTQFTVRRDGDSVFVSVQRGIVRVSHPSLAQPRLLEIGDSISVGRDVERHASPQTAPIAAPTLPATSQPTRLPSAEPVPTEERPSSPPQPAATPERRRERARSAARAWQDHAQNGDYEQAFELLEAGGFEAQTSAASNPTRLMQLADVARYSGHPRRAVEPLERLLAEHPGHASASLAAFTLGQIELDRLHRPAHAARHFQQALDSGLNRALVGDAYARLARSHEAAGDAASAERAACSYLREAPRGPHRQAMTELCSSTTEGPAP